MNDVLNNQGYDFGVKFWGDWACFTRPELKVERMTYPVMTPSAARGALEAIFWKPEIRWEIREIWVLSEIKEMSIMRNELNDRQSTQIETFITEDKRAQRTSLFLKEPSYLVFADIIVKPLARTNKKGYIDQINRRLEKGSCFHQPYLGTRECTAFFKKADEDDMKKLIPINLNIGCMLFDTAFPRNDDVSQDRIQFIRHRKGIDNNIREIVWGIPQHVFFEASIENGKLIVPSSKYDELYGLEGFDV